MINIQLPNLEPIDEDIYEKAKVQGNNITVDIGFLNRFIPEVDTDIAKFTRPSTIYWNPTQQSLNVLKTDLNNIINQEEGEASNENNVHFFTKIIIETATHPKIETKITKAIYSEEAQLVLDWLNEGSNNR